MCLICNYKRFVLLAVEYITIIPHGRFLGGVTPPVTSLTSPPPPDLSAALQSFTATGDLRSAAAAHARIIILHDLASSSFSLWNKLLKFYLNYGHPRDVRLLFDQMPNRDAVSYNTFISAHIRSNGDPTEAVFLYSRMLEEGMTPNALTLSVLLSGYNTSKYPCVLMQLHSHAIKFGLCSDGFVGGALVNCYERLSGLEDAICAFEDITEFDSVSWNIMIDACACSGNKEKTVSIFLRMRWENGGCFDCFALTSVLKTCLEKKDLDLGMQLHSCALKFGLDSDTPAGNALLTMYSRCGEAIDSASQVFERIPKPNIITWTAMLSAFVQYGMTNEVISFYRKMLGVGITENEYCFATVLPAFSELSVVEHGRMIHSRVLKSKVQSDVGVGNALMDMYFKCGSLEDAHLVFQTMKNIDVVSWTIMIYGYGQHGKGRKALELFELMKKQGFKPDGVTFLGALSACSHGGLVNEGLGIVESMIGEYCIKPRREHCACVVDLFGRAGRLREAEGFIEEMGAGSDPLVWETLLGACEIYGEMEVGKRSADKLMALKPGNNGPYVSLSNIYAEQKMWEEKGELRQRLDASGMRKDAAQSWFSGVNYTACNLSDLSAALQSFTATGDLRSAAAAHARIIILHDLASSSFSLWNKLLKFYLNYGHPRDVRLLFDQMPNRDAVSYNTFISAHIRSNGDPTEAVFLYSRMLEEGMTPNALTLSVLLSGYNTSKYPCVLMQLHSHAIKFGLCSDGFVGGALVNCYERLSGLEDAICAFEDITEFDSVSWNIMIDACACSGNKEKTVSIFLRMRWENGGCFDCFALTSVLKTCLEKKDLDLGMQLHSCALKFGLDSDTPAGNALLTMYSRCGEAIDSASQVFERIPKPNIITWTAMLSAFVQYGMTNEVISFYRKMLGVGITENEYCFATVLPAFSELSVVEHGRMIHSRVLKSKVQSDVGVGNALMDMYFKCGSLEDAHLVFQTMKNIDVVSWTIMIYGYGQHGKGRKALELFELMKKQGFKPDGVTFLGALSACSHGGLVNEGLGIVESMIGEYCIKPRREHCACVVDLFGRAGRLREAEGFIEEMGAGSDPLVWETLLGACEIYGEMEVGKRSADKLMALKPGNNGPYVSLSNIYAEQKMWEEKGELRQRLDASGMRKDAAQSWV
ncbi:pentatricopeptide repeat-containing protein At1g74600, chloroplastic-like [Phalaenopsis equestris]|uniref:pentatricopeptide repeat-containing protein At1g74600, chloroplastic-like n=1 Tax=Phalaenopsis equestris TaxID=78828 RepID=UPI0009E5A987|nr:pentatricopeptide repeat-containing protein At1g74600, chloroplastic-like [Phalaenopsis equestris]